MKTEEFTLNVGLKRLRRIYYTFWLVVVLSVVLGELLDSLSGTFASNELSKYIAEVLTIAVTGLSIPIALKLVANKEKKIKSDLSLKQAFQIYYTWSKVRVILLGFAAVLAIATHYLFLSSAGAFCAVVVCLAAFLCVPSLKKLRYVLSPVLNENQK